jgi:hypothetical protein
MDKFAHHCLLTGVVIAVSAVTSMEPLRALRAD